MIRFLIILVLIRLPAAWTRNNTILPETAIDIINDSLGIPDLTEQNRIRNLTGTYGQTFYNEHIYGDLRHSIRTEQLMLHLSEDIWNRQQIITEWDKHFNVSTAEKKKNRADIQAPPVVGVNAWERAKRGNSQL